MESLNWQRLLQSLGHVMLVTILMMGGVFIVFTQKDRHPSLGHVTLAVVLTMDRVFVVFTQEDRNPGLQLMFNLVKNTMIVLGGGLQGCRRWHECTCAGTGWQWQWQRR